MHNQGNEQLVPSLNEVRILLSRTRPRSGLDGQWSGPWFVAGPRLWFPTLFLLHRGRLDCRMEIGTSNWFELRWVVGGQEVELPPEESCIPRFVNGPELWGRILQQTRQKLIQALESPSEYNRYVEDNIPIEARRGLILRRLLWAKDGPPPLSTKQVEAFCRAAERGRIHEQAPPAEDELPQLSSNTTPPRSRLTRRQYMADAAVGYDAVFPDTRSLGTEEKYRRYADGRHGGLLFLAENDQDGFRAWFHGSSRHGSHPFEIVEGVPQGIHLYVQHNEHEKSWSYSLTVSEFTHYANAARMLLAFDAAGVPVAFPASQAVAAALRGDDDVRVGFGPSAIHVSDIEASIVDQVRWDALPQLFPLRDDGASGQVAQAEQGQQGPSASPYVETSNAVSAASGTRASPEKR